MRHWSWSKIRLSNQCFIITLPIEIAILGAILQYTQYTVHSMKPQKDLGKRSRILLMIFSSHFSSLSTCPLFLMAVLCTFPELVEGNIKTEKNPGIDGKAMVSCREMP